MKYLFTAVIALSLFFIVQQSFAQDHRNFGLGVMVGEPSGLSAKLWTSADNAFDFGLGWSLRGDRVDNGVNEGSRTHFHMDYLWHSFNTISSTERFPLYYGIGGRINSGGGFESTLAIRGVFGVAWMPRKAPVDVFFELVPSFQVSSSSGLAVDGAFGARYYF